MFDFLSETAPGLTHSGPVGLSAAMNKGECSGECYCTSGVDAKK